ncbi:energy transducer TonB [Silvibacterium dinghuense]|nr:energy transducer TonB [Silvibacterium dinghuense]GGH02356.1 hypothetical protein GCM10011586_17730 [Silvibacterium dinghuense]
MLIRIRSLTALLGVALLSAPALFAQNSTPRASTSNISMPNNPKALLDLAREVSGLTSAEMKPWHAKYSYQTFDRDGKPANQGTVEEWWAAPNKYKREWVSDHFNQTEYQNERGHFRSGDPTLPPAAELTLLSRITEPIPPPDKLAGYTIQHRDNPYSHEHFVCIETAGHLDHILAGPPFGLFPVYCFEQNKPILRTVGSFGTHTTLYQQVGSLAGHSVPIQLQIVDGEKSYASAHLEEGNLIGTVNEAAFQPPPDAVETGPNNVLSEKVDGLIKGHRIAGDPPIYPVESKQQHWEGEVDISAIIAEDGTIQQLMVISAPDYRLAAAAMLAVHTWRFQPFLLRGKPVSVQTQINVTYRLGG